MGDKIFAQIMPSEEARFFLIEMIQGKRLMTRLKESLVYLAKILVITSAPYYLLHIHLRGRILWLFS